MEWIGGAAAVSEYGLGVRVGRVGECWCGICDCRSDGAVASCVPFEVRCGGSRRGGEAECWLAFGWGCTACWDWGLSIVGACGGLGAVAGDARESAWQVGMWAWDWR